MNKAINTLVLATVDSLTKFKNKLAYYLAIFAMVFGSTFGTMNAANAADVGNGVVHSSATATAYDFNVAAKDLDITTGLVMVVNVGAVTDTAVTGDVDIATIDGSGNTPAGADPAAATITIASITLDAGGTAGNVTITDTDDNTGALTVNITGDLITGGTLTITTAEDTDDELTTVDVGGTLTVTGATEIDAGGSSVKGDILVNLSGADITFTGGVDLADISTTGSSTLMFDGTVAQTITGAIDGDAADEGILKIDNTSSGGATFATAIGATALTGIDISESDSTATFNLAVDATTITNTGTATFTTTTTATNINIETTGTATFTGKIIETDSSTSELDLAGAATAIIGFGHTTAGSSNTMDDVDMSSTATLILADTITNGMHVFGTASVDAADIADGSKIYMPVNLSNGQTIIIFKTDGGADVDEATDSALQNNALMTYDAAGTNTTIVTATEVAEATVATNLSIATNEARALSQAYAAAINDTVADATAEDAFGNALNALGGMTATTDTDLALQVAPQTDTIGGSAVATRAMTGTVQGIVSNRMASLRSGDAYVTGISAGNGMSANSGFIQAFGSEAEQKNTGPTTAKVYGYDSSTSGLAIGFDGMTDDGSTIGLSASYSSTDVDGKGTGKSKNAIDSYTVSVYADKATDNGYIEGSLTYGINDNTSSRLVNTAGLSRTYTGNYDSEQISLKVGGGAPQEVKDGTFVTPYFSATGTIISTDSYTETSTTASDALRLKIAQDDINSLVGTAGVKAHMVTDKGTPMISFAINNEFGDTTINSTNTYTGGGTAFKTSTNVEELSATLGLGYSFGNDVSSININYEANANEDDYLSHYGTVKIISKF